jgi:thiol:disulfide interchange protein DsbA
MSLKKCTYLCSMPFIIFAELGVDPLAFARTYNSFGVRASTQQAEAKGRAYRSSGVPALIVNGKYRIEGSMAGSNANMLLIADYLIAKERQLLADSQSGTLDNQHQSAD